MAKIIAPYTSGTNTISIDMPTGINFYVEDNVELGPVTKATNDGTYAVSTLSTSIEKTVLIAKNLITWKNFDGTVLDAGGSTSLPHDTMHGRSINATRISAKILFIINLLIKYFKFRRKYYTINLYKNQYVSRIFL